MSVDRRDLASRIIRVGLKRRRFDDVYHYFLTISWTRLFGLLVAFYVGLNCLFAVGYWLDADALDGARTGSFLDCFFFSVQTMATIGYGKLTPKSNLANVFVTIEALFGMLATAMATGLMFAKFSRPTARVMFSKHLLIAKRNGQPTLSLRMANARANQIVEASLRLIMLREETTSEGERMRRIIELPLMRSNSPAFMVSWTVFHVIDEKSPLFGMDEAAIKASNVDFAAALIGTDETFSQTVHARSRWAAAEDILFNKRFGDMTTNTPDGMIVLDYSKFDDLVDIVAEVEQ